MTNIKSNFSIFLFCTHIDEVQIFNETKSIIRLENIAVEFEDILKARNQQNYAMNAAIFFSQTNNSKNFWNSKHESQELSERIILKNFDFEKKNIVTTVRFYYSAKINEWF